MPSDSIHMKILKIIQVQLEDVIVQFLSATAL